MAQLDQEILGDKSEIGNDKDCEGQEILKKVGDQIDVIVDAERTKYGLTIIPQTGKLIGDYVVLTGKDEGIRVPHTSLDGK